MYLRRVDDVLKFSEKTVDLQIVYENIVSGNGIHQKSLNLRKGQFKVTHSNAFTA